MIYIITRESVLTHIVLESTIRIYTVYCLHSEVNPVVRTREAP